MTAWLVSLIAQSLDALAEALYALLVPLAVFALLALIVKGRRLFSGIVKLARETRINLLLLAVNVVFVVPLLAIVSTWIGGLIGDHGLHMFSDSGWELLPDGLIILAAVIVGDFVGYWRHRLEHCRLLWPAHAVHHSDTALSWLSLERFHPINRMTTMAIDTTVLLLLGFPVYAIIANNLVRHYYGYFIHADLPWTYGRLNSVFVSPVMHRWHHANDPVAYRKNFATVFAIFDKMFGTYYVPGPCKTDLGVSHAMGSGVLGQLTYAFRPDAYHFHRRTRRSGSPRTAPSTAPYGSTTNP